MQQPGTGSRRGGWGQRGSCIRARASLSGNFLGIRGSRLLAMALSERGVYQRTLESLALRHCQMGPVGTRALAPALGSQTGLVMLDLSWNDVEDAGVRALVNGLGMGASSISQLVLRGNRVSEAGVRSLVPWLSLQTKLFHLGCVPARADRPRRLLTRPRGSLGWNYLTGSAVVALVAAIRGKHPPLEELDLEESNIGPDGW